MGNKPEEKKEYGKFGVQVRKAKIIYNLQLIMHDEQGTRNVEVWKCNNIP
jgi:hypothetical protein